MFRLDSKKIILLYNYYLLGKIRLDALEENQKKPARIRWFKNCLKKEKYLQEKVAKKLKTGWEFSRLPPLERALLVFATYELFFGPKSNYPKMIIDQVINFSKVYCERGKYKYINKVLDLLVKEQALFEP